MFDDSKRKAVDLRGASKKESKSEILARAQRERAERERQRRARLSALLVQTTFRKHVDMSQLRATLRAQFDSERVEGLTFAQAAPVLASRLLLVHQHSEPSDDERRRWLLHAVLQSAASPDPSSNAAAIACASAEGAQRWGHLCRRLVHVCLPHLVPASAAAPAEPPIELAAANYLLDASRWSWTAHVPAAVAALLPTIASSSVLSLGRRGLDAAVAAALRRLLSPLHPLAAGAAAGAPGTSPLVAPVLALSIRHLHAACASPAAAAPSQPPPPPPPVAAMGAPAAASAAASAPLPSVILFARALLCDPLVLPSLPPSLLSLFFAPALAPAILALAPSATRLVSLLDPGDAPLAAAHFCANLALLLHSVSTGGGGAVGGAATVLGAALPSYVALLHGCLDPVAAALAHRAATGGLDASGEGGSDEEGGASSAPMEAEGGAAETGYAALCARLHGLVAPSHLAALWCAVLSPDAPPPVVACAPYLAAVSCELIYSGGGGGGGGGPLPSADGHGPSPRAMATLSAIAFSAELNCVGQLWHLTAAAQASWGTRLGGSLLALFATLTSHLLVAIDDTELFDAQRPFSTAALRPMCLALKTAALASYWPPPAASAAGRADHGPAHAPPPALAGALLRLVRQLFDRDARRSFMGGGADDWLADPARQTTIESLALRMDPRRVK